MNGIFTPVDYILIAVYFSVLVGMGIYLQRKASASVEDYFIGGRKLPWWLLGVSGMAQFIDITGTALIISFLFMMGPKALLVELRGGMVIHMPIILLWAGKWRHHASREARAFKASASMTSGGSDRGALGGAVLR